MLISSKVERAIIGALEYSKKRGGVLKSGVVGREYGVVGLDIEADSESARPFLLAGSCAKLGDISTDLDSWGDVVKFLCRYSWRDTVNFFYNLQYDFEGMLKLLPKEYGVRLLTGDTVEIDDWKVKYVPKKAFEIGKGKKVWRFFDLWQYFLMSLARAAELNLDGDVKGSFDTTEVSRDKYMRGGDYAWELVKYCRDDARLARLLGELIVDGANRFVDTREFYSSAGVSEKYFRSNGFYIPWISPAIDKAFMRCYNGGRFEITKRGVIEGVVSVDIKSAYPFVMTQMPILDESVKAKAVRGGSRDLDARYGAYCIDTDVPEDYLGLIPKKIDGTLCFPVGDFKSHWVDKACLELLDEIGVGYRIRGGAELFQKEVGTLEPLIRPLFDMKEDKVKYGPAVRYAAKINMNGLYGKLIQLIDDVTIEEIKEMDRLNDGEYDEVIEAGDRWFNRTHTGKFKTGSLFAPYYASHTTSETRNMLVRKGLDIGLDKVVGMHTDSLQFLGTGHEDTPGLGGWETEFIGRVELVKCGMYRMVGDDGKIKIRSRGVGLVDSVIEDSYMVKRRFGLNQAMRNKWVDLNKIREVELIMDLNTDKKRVWSGEICKQDFLEGRFIDSEPIIV